MAGMTSSQIVCVVAIACALAACGAAPLRAPEAVAVEARTLTPRYSAFNARMLSEAASLDHRFVTSLDPGKEALTRLESTYTSRFGTTDEMLRIGDTISASGMWGTSVRFGGVQLGNRIEARGDVIASSRIAATGIAVLPTVADALFASAADPGTALARQNISIDRSLRSSGTAAWSLVANDPLGHSESIDAPMIASTRLVEPGCSAFSVGFGKVRRDYALTSNEYGPTFASTTLLCGAPMGFTVEGHGEYLADEAAAVGIGVARQFGSLGTASLALASSRAEGGSGWLARVGFEHHNSLFNVMLRSRMQSRDFREVGATLLDDPIMQRDLASVGVNVADGASLSLAYAAQTTWTQQRTNLLALKQSVSLGHGSLSMSAGHSLEDNFGSSMFISYRRPIGSAPPRRSLVEEFDLGPLHGTLH